MGNERRCGSGKFHSNDANGGVDADVVECGVMWALETRQALTKRRSNGLVEGKMWAEVSAEEAAEEKNPWAAALVRRAPALLSAKCHQPKTPSCVLAEEEAAETEVGSEQDTVEEVDLNQSIAAYIIHHFADFFLSQLQITRSYFSSDVNVSRQYITLLLNISIH